MARWNGHDTEYKMVGWRKGDDLGKVLTQSGILRGDGWYTGDGSPAVISPDGEVRRLFVKANKYWHYE